MTHANQSPEPAIYQCTHSFINSGEPGLYDSGNAEQHEVILQALNRYIPYERDNKTVKVYYGLDNFTGTEPGWNKAHVFFQEDGTHPDMADVVRDPEGAIKRVNGRRAGALLNSLVLPGPGQPRLKSYIQFMDPEVAALYAAGELGVSTALYSKLEQGKLSGKVVPNHVLLFRTGKTQPRDLGSMFLNSDFLESNDPKEGEKIDKLDEILNGFTNSLKGLFNSGGPGGNGGGGDGGQGGNGGGPGGNGPGGPGGEGGDGGKEALANALQIKDAELKAGKDREATLTQELKNTQETLQKFQNAEADRTWTALKNTTIPPGLVETKEKEAALRELYNTDRDGFYQKILKVKGNAPGSGREGEGFTNSEQFQKLQQVNTAWDMATGATITVQEK